MSLYTHLQHCLALLCGLLHVVLLMILLSKQELLLHFGDLCIFLVPGILQLCAALVEIQLRCDTPLCLLLQLRFQHRRRLVQRQERHLFMCRLKKGHVQRHVRATHMLLKQLLDGALDEGTIIVEGHS